MKTWFVTGGTPGGFGMAYAEAALEMGDRVALTARRPEELREWAQAHGDRVLVLPLDVTDAGQVRKVVRAAEERFGGIDVLVNNAGRGWYGSVEGTEDDDVRRMFELNFFAVLSVIRAVLPGMRARRNGGIVTMSSVAGLRGVTGFGYYSATKHAIEAVTDVLREEVAPLGIRVMAVEPGAFRTRAYAGFADEPITESIAEYRPMLDDVRAAMIDQDGRQPGDPRRGVRAVIAAMSQEPPPRRLVLGSGGFDAVVAALESTLAEIRTSEPRSREADSPSPRSPCPIARHCLPGHPSIRPNSSTVRATNWSRSALLVTSVRQVIPVPPRSRSSAATAATGEGEVPLPAILEHHRMGRRIPLQEPVLQPLPLRRGEHPDLPDLRRVVRLRVAAGVEQRALSVPGRRRPTDSARPATRRSPGRECRPACPPPDTGRSGSRPSPAA
ncbi:SDR family NAD(P)-dependent oxidoreductase [Micromonospora sp. NPDC051925]|uniref:SDR family NAD(P)-dependent oxidoreductase n=1 Tax=Micromonospora sp. NPDC051925 TaxID=3364288 RepID=UPI0037CA030D